VAGGRALRAHKSSAARAVSISANIAEGAARRTTGEFLQFIGIAKGSVAEVETLLYIAARLGYAAEAKTDSLLSDTEEIGRMLSGLAGALETNH
jgi:four helix bundle protein